MRGWWFGGSSWGAGHMAPSGSGVSVGEVCHPGTCMCCEGTCQVSSSQRRWPGWGGVGGGGVALRPGRWGSPECQACSHSFLPLSLLTALSPHVTSPLARRGANPDLPLPGLGLGAVAERHRFGGSVAGKWTRLCSVSYREGSSRVLSSTLGGHQHPQAEALHLSGPMPVPRVT